jgi:uncharacterized membrane protein
VGGTMGTIPKRVHRFEAKMADRITQISGSMNFVYLHILAFTLFFIFRPFAVEVFNILLSLEAVFLATFIMVAQNRELEMAEERAEEEDKEEEEAHEDIQESFEDLQDEFDDLQKDLEDIKKLIEKIETRRNLEKPTGPN